jgi:hypothetical protein
MEVPVIEKLLPAPGEMRAIMTAHQARKRALPMDGEAFEPFEEVPVE